MTQYFDFSQAAAGLLALYGGTFDPVHRGHIYVARQVMEAMGLDQVVFLPAGQPPHKMGHVSATAPERWRMLELALEGEAGLSLSDYEIGRQTRCYTADTLEALRALCPRQIELVFILGGDSLLELGSWYRPQVILELARLAVVARPGAEEAALREKSESLQRTYGARIELILCDGLDISSTQIRQAAREGRSLAPWVPGRVAAYIRENQIYQEARE